MWSGNCECLYKPTSLAHLFSLSLWFSFFHSNFFSFSLTLSLYMILFLSLWFFLVISLSFCPFCFFLSLTTSFSACLSVSLYLFLSHTLSLSIHNLCLDSEELGTCWARKYSELSIIFIYLWCTKISCLYIIYGLDR